MLRVEIPINLSFSFQIEPLSCFATVKNQIYTPTKLLLSFGCQGRRVEVGSWGERVKEEKKGKKKKRKGSKLNYQRFFQKMVVFCGPVAIFRLQTIPGFQN